MNFAYLPKIVPDPPSTMRQQAYEESSSIPGPDADPEGWKVLPTIKVRGTLFEVQKFEVECTVCCFDNLLALTCLSYCLL